MPKRNDKRDTAKAEYIKRRRSGEKVNLKDLAEKLGVTYGTVRNWKRIDQWDDAVERKRGGQPGNKNSRGKRNAKGNPGGGAPNGNTNAEKDGAYSTVHLERLSQEERDWLDQMKNWTSSLQERHSVVKAKISRSTFSILNFRPTSAMTRMWILWLQRLRLFWSRQQVGALIRWKNLKWWT